MHIQGTNRIHSPQGLNGPHYSAKTSEARSTGAAGKADRVEISPAAAAAMEAAEGAGQVRTDLVARIRNEIAAGTYDTTDKMNAAMDRMFDQIG